MFASMRDGQVDWAEVMNLALAQGVLPLAATAFAPAQAGPLLGDALKRGAAAAGHLEPADIAALGRSDTVAVALSTVPVIVTAPSLAALSVSTVTSAPRRTAPVRSTVLVAVFAVVMLPFKVMIAPVTATVGQKYFHRRNFTA